jgi:hypothetical protein
MKKERSYPLSVSAYVLYMECAFKFFLERILGLRPIVQMSYLVFGTAVDKGCNVLLAGGSILEACQTLESELNRLLHEPFDFIADDYDGELLDEHIKESLLNKMKELGSKSDNVDEIASVLMSRGYTGRVGNQNKALAILCHASLLVKGMLALRAFELQVLPMITKVEGVQVEINWKDEKGNSFKGFLDVPAELKGYGSVIGDNKTSSNALRDYGPDSVRKSFQLAIYAGVTGKTKGAYFVMEKKIKKNRVKTCVECGNVSVSTHKTCNAETEGKRCGGEWTETVDPECKITIVVDDIPKDQIDISQKALTSVAEAVKAGCYPMNLNSCTKTYGFGDKAFEVRCPFYNYCRTGSMEGLKKREERK